MVWSRSALSLSLLLLFGCPKDHGELAGFSEPPKDGTKIVDPVTGAPCDKGPATEAAVYLGRTFYFCDDRARVRFGESPAKYAYR